MLTIIVCFLRTNISISLQVHLTVKWLSHYVYFGTPVCDICGSDVGQEWAQMWWLTVFMPWRDRIKWQVVVTRRLKPKENVKPSTLNVSWLQLLPRGGCFLKVQWFVWENCGILEKRLLMKGGSS